MARIWSQEQQEIFSWFKTGRGNLVVRARAGTGKTTTIIEAAQMAPEGKILLAAFNKSIAVELQSRIKGDRVKAKTLHGLGFSYVMRMWGKVNVSDGGERAKSLTERACPTAPYEVKRLVSQIHTKMREMTPNTNDIESALYIMSRFDHMPDDTMEARGYEAEDVAEAACRAVDFAKERTDAIDFADMIFLPIVHRAIIPWYDMVIVDECQDMTGPQLQIATGACRKSGRIAIVGDDRQAIYGFRGADSGGLDRLKAKLNAKELGLTTTYRCPKRIVSIASRIVPDFKAAPEAPEGLVEKCSDEKMMSTAGPRDFILSRTNAPLIKICMALLKAGKRATIKGRDIGKGIIGLVNKLAPSDLGDLRKQLDDWYAHESQRAMKMSSEDAAAARIEYIADQRAICLAISESVTTVSGLKEKLEVIFSDADDDVIVCSTTHRAKGLEADNVYLLEGTFRGGDGEESNIKYVAITRAKKRLVWVSGYGAPQPESAKAAKAA